MRTRSHLVLLYSLALLSAGCGDDGDGGGDTVPIIDQGLRDFGVPVCEGSATACSALSLDACDGTPGCSAFECTGSATSCSSLDEVTCRTVPGCNVVGEAPVDLGTADGGPADMGADDMFVNECAPRSGNCHPYFDADCDCGYSTSDVSWACGRAGGATVGSSCTDFGQCAGGLICHRGQTGDTGRCRRRCEADDECGTGERCAHVGDLSSAPCSGYCLPTAQCSVESQDCPVDRGCYVSIDGSGTEYQFCHPAGAEEAGGFCSAGNSISCQPGLLCGPNFIGTSYRCRELCDTDDDCSGTTSCTGMLGSVQICR